MLPRPGPKPASPARRRGAALLLSLLVLFVIVAIVFQINVTTGTDARVARNDVGLTAMDLAIESALLQVDQQLEEDAQAEAAAGGGEAGADAAAAAAAAGGEGEGAGAEAGGSEPSDSREDAWARPQQTTFGELEVRLRILVQDEDAKYNVLALLSEDEELAEQALGRLTRILDLCREDTDYDIGTTDAERMARGVRDYLVRRGEARLERPEQLSYDDTRPDVAAPLTLSELRLLESFEPHHFRDFRDGSGRIVHSLGSYLTLWTSLSTYGEARGGSSGAGGAEAGAPAGQGAPEGRSADAGDESDTATAAAPDGEPAAGGGGQDEGLVAGGDADGTDLSAGTGGPSGGPPGWAVNVNTAPAAVLKGLFEPRDLDPRFWDEVIRYRNEEEEEESEDEEADPVYDEFGNEVVERKIFDTPGELGEIPDWIELPAEVREELDQLVTTKSQVFSIFVTAIQKTGVDDGWLQEPEDSRDEFEKSLGNQLVRTVRSVVWRRVEGGEVTLVPIVRWEVLDYVPFEVQDFPEEDR
jgi:type II secretory pathway component PulK